MISRKIIGLFVIFTVFTAQLKAMDPKKNTQLSDLQKGLSSEIAQNIINVLKSEPPKTKNGKEDADCKKYISKAYSQIQSNIKYYLEVVQKLQKLQKATENLFNNYHQLNERATGDPHIMAYHLPEDDFEALWIIFDKLMLILDVKLIEGQEVGDYKLMYQVGVFAKNLINKIEGLISTLQQLLNEKNYVVMQKNLELSDKLKKNIKCLSFDEIEHVLEISNKIEEQALSNKIEEQPLSNNNTFLKAIYYDLADKPSQNNLNNRQSEVVNLPQEQKTELVNPMNYVVLHYDNAVMSYALVAEKRKQLEQLRESGKKEKFNKDKRNAFITLINLVCADGKYTYNDDKKYAYILKEVGLIEKDNSITPEVVAIILSGYGLNEDGRLMIRNPIKCEWNGKDIKQK